jgi:hypothetical protein
VWVGVPVPVILSQELFDRVQAKLQESRKKYRHPMTHYLLSELVRCGECGASCPSYRRHLGYPLVTGERRIYHRAAYKCVSGTSNKMHARKNITPCRNPQIATHLLEDAVFDIIQKQMLDPITLRSGIDELKSDGDKDHAAIANNLMTLAREIQKAEERKRQLIDLYASGVLSEAVYVDGNVALDQELHALKHKKQEFTRGLPLLHTESVDLSIQQFCGAARARFERCTTFEDKRQFLVDFIERVVYDRYRVSVIGSVSIKTQIHNSQEIETRKLSFCLRGEIDKTTLHKTKPRKKFAEDGRMDGGSSWRRKRPTISATTSAYPLPYITSEHSSTT